MGLNNFPLLTADILAAIFAVTAVIDLAGSRYIRARFRQWRYPRQFYRVMGVLQLFAALYLVVPQLRVWGIILAGFIAFFWIVIFLNHRQWNWAAAGMLMLMALVPTSLAIP
jgi:hypothetical protein